VARVGDDDAGRQATAELTAAGVRCAFTVDPVAGTCCVVVLVDPDGQRDMLSDRGASAALRPTDLGRETLDGAAHLHLSGYVLRHSSSRPAGLAALAAARAAGLSTSVDPQTTGGLDDPREFLRWVAGVDLLLPNADELESLTSSTEPASAVGLLDRVGAVVVTSGAAGASWVDRDGVRDQPAADVRCVDSTGAGDAFDAGLLASWVVERDPRAALRAGVAAGSAAVTQLGARPVTSR
jgi:sugar/nucleoside kinase (ribokinase family)